MPKKSKKNSVPTSTPVVTSTPVPASSKFTSVIPHSISNHHNSFNYESIVVCKYNGKNDHLLKKPKLLPCGNTVCADCIISNRNSNTNEFKCNYEKCNQIHVIQDIDLLKINLIADDAIRDNLETLSLNVFEQLKHAYDEAKTSISNDKINKIFNSIESDIITRVNTIQKELIKLKDDLVQIVKDFKHNFISKAQFDFKIEEKNFFKFKEEFQLFLNTQKQNKANKVINIDVEQTDEQLRKRLYDCENYLKQLNHHNNSFSERLNNISFNVASEWVPDTSIIGKLQGSNITKFLIKLIHNKPKVINFNNESIHGICNLFDENLLATCVDTNKLILIDKNYNLVKQYTKISELTLSCPLGVCHNNGDYVYICDLMNHRVIITDRDMNMRKIIGDSSSKPIASSDLGKFNRSVDACFYAGNLYVLDCLNKRVQEFTADGEFKREIKLVKIAFDVDKRSSLLSTDENAYHKRPLRLDVIEDTIAVIDDYEELFLYNFAGELKQTIKKSRLMCFVDTYLFTCDDHGLLTCYEKHKNGQHEEYLALFKRKIEILQPPISFMKFFNGHLTVSLGGSKKGIAIF